MNSMKKFFSLLFLVSLLYSCSGTKSATVTQPAEAKKTVSDYAGTITETELKDDLYIYASDEFEGRDTGEPGQKKAVEFLKNRYESLGISGALPDGKYIQKVPLERQVSPEVTFTLGDKSFKKTDDFVSFSGSDGTLTADEVVYLGYGINDEKYNDYKDIDVKDKIILIKSGEPKNNDGNYIISGGPEISKWSNMQQEFQTKAEVAKKAGAKALLFYSPAIYGMVAQRFGNDDSGKLSLKDDNNQENGNYFLMVNTSVAETIVNDIADNAKPKVIPIRFNLSYSSKGSEVDSENVVAVIKGSEKPQEYIVISSHLDHIGMSNGQIYNGADDDGSGTVALLQIAEAFKKAVENGQEPKRSVVFLHVTGEEKGLLGSKYYTDVDPIFPLDQTVANLNIDMIGRIDPERKSDNRNYVYLIGSDKLSTQLHNISEEMNTKYTQLELDYTFNDENDPNRFYYRSDHYNFAKNNIPIIFYFSGTHADYHQPSDTPDKINYDLLEKRTRLIFYTAWELANRTNRIAVDVEVD